jgi:hypothetical protein
MSLRFLKALSLSVLCASILIGPAHAQQPPVLPFSPWGAVKLNGTNVPAGTEVSAWCGGVRYASTTKIDLYNNETWYSNLDIPGDSVDTPGAKEGCAPNEIVSFKIGAAWAKEEGSWTSGGSGRVNLTTTTSVTLPFKARLPLVRR